MLPALLVAKPAGVPVKPSAVGTEHGALAVPILDSQYLARGRVVIHLEGIPRLDFANVTLLFRIIEVGDVAGIQDRYEPTFIGRRDEDMQVVDLCWELAIEDLPGDGHTVAAGERAELAVVVLDAAEVGEFPPFGGCRSPRCE